MLWRYLCCGHNHAVAILMLWPSSCCGHPHDVAMSSVFVFKTPPRGHTEVHQVPLCSGLMMANMMMKMMMMMMIATMMVYAMLWPQSCCDDALPGAVGRTMTSARGHVDARAGMHDNVRPGRYTAKVAESPPVSCKFSPDALTSQIG